MVRNALAGNGRHMNESAVFFPHLSARTDGSAAVGRFRRAHEGYTCPMEQVEKLGAQALISAAVVLGVDPVDLGFGLRDGQLATALTAGQPLVSSEIAEKRLEVAAACVAGWAETLARRVRMEGNYQADRLSSLAGDIRQEWGRMQHLLYREGAIRRTQVFSVNRESTATATDTQTDEAVLRERVVALSLELERARVEATQRERIVEQIQDEHFQLRAKVESLEEETARLRKAAAGWKQEAQRTRRHQIHSAVLGDSAEGSEPGDGAAGDQP